MNEQRASEIRKEVELRTASFETAERSRDADALMRHFSDAGDFYMHSDGQRLGLDDLAATVRGAFPTLAALEGGFVDLKVHVLAHDAALATARFQETITTKSGAAVHQRGAASWLWRLRDNEWKIVYGHVDHYPASPAGKTD